MSQIGSTVFAALLSLWLITASARAEITVRGTAAALRVEAVGAPLDEVLSRLGAIDLRYQGPAVPGRILTGTYSGSLSQVLARILEGISYYTRNNGNQTILTIVNVGGGQAHAAAAPPVQQPVALPANPGQRTSLIPESEL